MTMLTALQVKFARLIRASGVFDDAFYRAGNPDVAAAGIDPLEHYIVAGEAESRFPCRYFDPEWYRAQSPAVAPGFCLLVHYLTVGDGLGLQPFVGIDPVFMREQDSRAKPALVTFLVAAARSAWRDPNRFFSYDYYSASNPDVAAAGIDCYWHFIVVGADEGRLPSAGFSWFHVRERFHLAGSNSAIFRQLMLRWRLLAWDEVAGGPSVTVLQQQVLANHKPAVTHQPRALPPLPGTRRACEVYAFYLPQFHRVAENDRWWGEGFTEWHNVVRGLPRFPGHYQPRIPAGLGFYDLEDPRVMSAQIALARQAGIDGFAFYYYNFGSKRLLERPLEQFLADPSLDIGYYVIWANETWSRRWDGSEDEVLIEQAYPESLIDDLADDLVRHFADPRYKRIDGRPLFVIYRASALPEPLTWIEALRRAFFARGHRPLLYLAQTFDDLRPEPFGLDGAMEFPPHKHSRTLPTISPPRVFVQNDALRIWSYDDFVAAAAAETRAEFPLIRTCFPSWDNDGRRQGASSIVHGATPEKFGQWLKMLVDAAETSADQPAMVCINAWNEWGEGAYLEPDRHFGYAFLNTVQTVMHPDRASQFGRIVLVGHDACSAGAQRLLLQIGRTLVSEMGVELCFVLLRADPGYDGLLADYRSVAETIVVDHSDLVASIADRLATRGFCHAIVNTSASANTLAPLSEHGFQQLLLVHELPAMLAALGTVDAIAAAAPTLRGVIAPTAAIATMLAANGVAAERIRVQPQGQYRLLPPVARVRVPEGIPMVVGIGRADRRKGIDLFVAACDAMSNSPHPFRFMWQGDWDPDARASLQYDADRLVAAGWLILKPDKHEISASLAVADVFFLASREDPLPSAAIEAWSSGLPVVAFTNTGGIANMIADDPVLGVLAPRIDPRAAVTALRDAIDPAALRECRSRRRAVLVAEQFDWGRYCRTLVDAVYAAPVVDAVIVGHGHGCFAGPRVDSLLCQALPPARILYCDMASADDSAAVAAAAAAASGGRVEFVAMPSNDGRLDRTWHAQAAASTAEFFHIAEGDDIIARTMIDRCVTGLQATPGAAFAFCAVDWIDAEGRLLASHIGYPASVLGEAIAGGGAISAEAMLGSNFFVKNPILSMSSVVWRRSTLVSLLAAHEEDFARMQFAYDWLLYILAARAGHSAVFIAEPLCQHRQHGASFAARTDIDRHVGEIARLYDVVPARDAVQVENRRAYLGSLAA